MSTSMEDRVKECIEQSGQTRGAVAAAIGLTDSQLSKSLGGSRNFSAAELALLAAEFDVSMYWLATGEQDPNEYRLVARHTFDRERGTYEAGALAEDRQLLDDVALLYHQAYS